MLSKIVILFAIMHVCCTFPYQSPIVSYNPQARGDFASSGLAQGYIRYVDADGSQRLVGYSYPEPVYTVHRLSFDSRNQGSIPLLKTSVHPGYIEQEYIYQGDESEAAREEHFRTWNSQRYQALKTEVDKLYAEGQTPSADMLARLKQLEEMTANVKQAIPNDTPEVKQAREEHLRLWNEARLRSQKPFVYQQVAQVTDQQSRFATVSAGQERAGDENNRLYNKQLRLIHSFEDDTQRRFDSVSHRNEKAGDEHQRLYNKQLDLIHSYGTAASQAAGVRETPEVQSAKQEHFRLWHEAKQRAENADKLNTVVYAVPKSSLQAPHQHEEGVKHVVTTVLQQPGQVHQAKFLLNDQQGQYDFANFQAERSHEKAELEAEELREKQRKSEDEKRLELEKKLDAERLQQEERLMAEEQKRVRTEDERRLRYDLGAQFVEENPANGFVTPAGVYVLTDNKYAHNPFLFRINAAQPTYYSFPAGRAGFAIKQGEVQLQPNVLQYHPSVTSAQAIQANNAQAVSELHKATSEHFRAHEESSKQLSAANEKNAAKKDCN